MTPEPAQWPKEWDDALKSVKFKFSKHGFEAILGPKSRAQIFEALQAVGALRVG